MKVPGGRVYGLYKGAIFWIVVNILTFVYAPQYIMWSLGATVVFYLITIWALRVSFKAQDREVIEHYQRTYGDKAEEMLIKAVEESNYEDGAILDSLGWLYFKKKKIELAKKWITQAYIMEPSEPEIIDHLSQIYLQLDRIKESRYLDNKIILFHKDYFKYDEVLNRN